VSAPILVCTDLDGTLLPIGPAPESPSARRRFAQLVERPQVVLAYVTGRHQALVEAAIAEFSLPVPQFVIADVGTTIYEVDGAVWQVWSAWRERLAEQWRPTDRQRLEQALEGSSHFRLQELAKQSDLKLSYYLAAELDATDATAEVQHRLGLRELPARLIFSRDADGTGLLDLVPPGAGKLAAIDFLMQQRGLSSERTVFAGDSGNDLEVLVSPLPAVLVANASPAVKKQARDMAGINGTTALLYQAQGGFLGMNGNYGAGVLEGVAHFLPKTAEWLT
jgi:HAD superfamily hydrolase (TIGR01484 family)